MAFQSAQVPEQHDMEALKSPSQLHYQLWYQRARDIVYYWHPVWLVIMKLFVLFDCHCSFLLLHPTSFWLYQSTSNSINLPRVRTDRFSGASNASRSTTELGLLFNGPSVICNASLGADANSSSFTNGCCSVCGLIGESSSTCMKICLTDIIQATIVDPAFVVSQPSPVLALIYAI